MNVLRLCYETQRGYAARGASLGLSATILLLVACGVVDFTGSNAGSSSGPAPASTVIPPIPVIGSYLTAVLTNEEFAPLTSITLISDSGLVNVTTNNRGLVRIPLAALTESSIELKVEYATKSIPIRIALPPDLSKQIESVREKSAEYLTRSLAVMIEEKLLNAVRNEQFSVFSPYHATALSVPLLTDEGLNAADPLYLFKVTSHQNDDQVPESLTLSGRCALGFKIGISGDLISEREETCINAGNGSQFSLDVTLAPGGGKKQLTLTHTDPSSGATVSSLLSVRAEGCPTGFVRIPASGMERLGHVAASTTHTDWWLNTSLDFCVMKYTAKKSATGTPTSTATALPWTDIAQTTAANSCNSLGQGYRLISNTQWQTIARNVESVPANWSGKTVGLGVMAKGHSDNVPPLKLEASADFDPYFGTQNKENQTPNNGWEQRRTLLLSTGDQLWDFAGNVRHWMSDQLADLGLSPGIGTGWGWVEFNNQSYYPKNGANAGVNRLILGPLGEYFSPSGVGKVYLANAQFLVRGGGWSELSETGVYMVSSYNPGAPHVGFRCVYNPN